MAESNHSGWMIDRLHLNQRKKNNNPHHPVTHLICSDMFCLLTPFRFLNAPWPIAMARSRSPRRKGGVRQRRKRRESLEGPFVTTSVLASLLMNLFAWGEMSPQVVQKIAKAAYEDACNMQANESNLEDLKNMGEIGASGRYSNKCFGELLKRVPFQIRVAMPKFTTMPFKAPLQALTQSVLWPHELFSTIYNVYPKTFKKCILPSTDTLRSFGKPTLFTLPLQIPKFQTLTITDLRWYR